MTTLNLLIELGLGLEFTTRYFLEDFVENVIQTKLSPKKVEPYTYYNITSCHVHFVT